MRNPGAVLAIASQSFVLFGQSWACRRRCRAAIPSALIVFFFRKDRRSQAAGAIVSRGVGRRGTRLPDRAAVYLDQSILAPKNSALTHEVFFTRHPDLCKATACGWLLRLAQELV